MHQNHFLTGKKTKNKYTELIENIREKNKIEFEEENLIDYIITEYTPEEINEARKKAMKAKDVRKVMCTYTGNTLIGYLICNEYL